jgi:hypothetical protein
MSQKRSVSYVSGLNTRLSRKLVNFQLPRSGQYSVAVDTSRVVVGLDRISLGIAEEEELSRPVDCECFDPRVAGVDLGQPADQS